VERGLVSRCPGWQTDAQARCARLCVAVIFGTYEAVFQRRIWPLWLVHTVRQFCDVASAGVQRSVFWCAWALRESPVSCRSRHPPGQVLQEGVPFFFLPLDLTLDLGMIGRSSSMDDVLGIELFGKIAGDVAGPVIRQQSWSVPDMGLVTARRRQRHFQGSVNSLAFIVVQRSR
jgi:hypothetical protein